MSFLNVFLPVLLCSTCIGATDPMASSAAHRDAEHKAQGYDLDKIKALPDEAVITWVLCPGYEMGKDDVIELVKSKELTIEGHFTIAKIYLSPEEKHEDEKHIALCWANDISGESDAKEKSKDDETEMKYFRDCEKLLLEHGKWNGHAFEYTYRWPGDKEKGKSIKVTVDITVKDPSSEAGAFLQGVIDRAKGAHHATPHAAAPHVPAPATQIPSAAQPPIIYNVPPAAVPPVGTVVVQEHAPYYVYPPYWGPGLWIGGGWGHHGWHRR